MDVQDKDGWTPLYLASIRGALEVVRLLLERGADVKVKDKNGETALQEVAARGYNKVVELLREYGAKY